ncbi:LysR family transcriptional regulator [Streptomyces sp. CMB-StM0423]|uniref:LysR family transcriptional regulator n=1 Tax=Streptomyces sp. CMB-StM0423 TaxID=2059884 RepID=UPI000C70F7F7|nr:LysR family transcriptional regulator [Streptomyces sp. CMB-StM0423]AUH39707.1 peptidase [Streptomyces sp. CMB-StM0423]
MELELRHLQAVCRIAETGSLAGAARLLGVSQPALSAQLRRIERVAGGELFTRTPRGVLPTPLGEFVLSKAHRVLGEMEALAAGARAAAAGPLRLGSIVLVMLGALVTELDELLPGRQTTVDSEDSVTALTRLLGSGHYDAILYGEVNDHRTPLPSGVTARTLVAGEPFWIALSARHRLAERERVELGDLADEQWMAMTSQDDGGPEALHAACTTAGFTPSLRYRIGDTALNRRLIAAGRAVAVFQPTAPATAGVALRPLSGDPIRGRLTLAWQRRAVPAEQANLLYRAASRAYEAGLANNPRYGTWWKEHPEIHPERT